MAGAVKLALGMVSFIGDLRRSPLAASLYSVPFLCKVGGVGGWGL